MQILNYENSELWKLTENTHTVSDPSIHIPLAGQKFRVRCLPFSANQSICMMAGVGSLISYDYGRRELSARWSLARQMMDCDIWSRSTVHLIDRSLVTLITSESASVQSYILHPKTYMLTKTILYLKYVALTRHCQTLIPNEFDC